MRKIRQFKCEVCEEYSEHLVNDDVVVVKCDCGGDKKKMLSAPRCFSNTTGRSPARNYKKVK